MDERRHYVDLPITRTLEALRRVRSLRDPSTHSTSKYSAVVDNLNWDTNSYGYAFDDLHGGDDGEEIQVWRSSYFTEKDKGAFRHDSYYGSRQHCSLRLMSPEMAAGLSENSHITTTQKSLHAKQLDRGCEIVPFDDFTEGSCPCNDSDGISKQRDHRRHRGGVSKGLKRRLKKHDRFAGDVSGKSPCLSMSRQSCSSVSLHENEDVLAMDSCHRGCGIGSCWSRTPRYREERTLLLGNMTLGSNRKDEESSRTLCQKFMPKSFDELVGHSEVAKSLLNAICNKQINSLYIFHGPRGTGKTSASRIFAAALNCLSSDIITKPCSLCQECTLFFSGRSIDVQEFDSSRINKMQRCRTLVKNAILPPVCSRFKVYIIDECQLLRRETWARILNCLDDLPPNVVFIMLTPCLEKLPRNALSQSQKYHFRNLGEADITRRLEMICGQEGLDFDADALSLMAAKSNGSLRDAEMMLDHLSLLGKKIAVSLIYEVNGVVSDEELLDLLFLALSSDAANTVKRARELMSSRIDPLQLISQMANLIMDILAGKCVVGAKRNLFGAANSEELSRALKILSQAEKQLRTSKNQSTWLTAALLQLGSPRSLTPEDGNFRSASSTSESSKHADAACACGNIENAKTGFQDLDLVWKRATSVLTSRCLKKFLSKRGQLVSIHLVQDITVAELEFSRPNHVTKAEKSWKVIASSLQHLLGYNVELRINLRQNTTNNHWTFKKLSFGLFACSSRAHRKSQFSTEFGSIASEKSDSTPSQTVIRRKYCETYSLDCGSSRLFHTCYCTKQLLSCIRNKDRNALSVGDNAQNEVSSPSGMTRENGTAAYRMNGGVRQFNQESKPRIKEYLKLNCWRMLPFRKRKRGGI